MAVFEKLRTDFKDRLGTMGNLTTSTLDNIKDKLNIKELLNEPRFASKPATNSPVRTSRSKRSFFESDEAAKRAEQLLAQVYPGYFEEDFDPVKHETSQLQTDMDQDEIDRVVERLAAAVEVVSGRLSSHVMKNHDKLIEGINTVASVEDDLQAAYMSICAARGTLKATGDDIKRNISVVTHTKRKQGYMNLMEVCLKLQKAKNLQQTLKKAQESGDYGEAMLLCVECFQGVESLKELSVSQELKATVNRLYVETTQKLDNTLQTICSDFNPTAYGKVLEGYMLQGISGKQMAQKVLTCFREAIHDNCTRVVRSLLLTKSKLAENLANSGLESSFGEMCRNLPLDLLRPCLYKLFEILIDLLSSYYIMMRWHEYGLKQKHLLKSMSSGTILPGESVTQPEGPAGPPAEATDMLSSEAGVASGTSSSRSSSSSSRADAAAVAEGASDVANEAELSQAELATRSFLTCVHEMLVTSKSEVWDAATWRIKELLSTIPFKGEDFIQVVEWCQKFLAIGESFIGGEAELRSAVVSICGKVFAAYHSSNLESLHMCLSTEQWKQIGSNGGRSAMLDSAVKGSPLYVPSFNAPGAVQDFEECLAKGNPFKRLDTKQQRRSKQLATNLFRARSHSSFGSRSELGLTEVEASDSSPESPASACTPGGMDFSEEEGRRSTPSSPAAGEPSTSSEPTGPARMLTITSQQILKWIKSYGELMRPLPGVADSIFHGITELFDAYLLETFMIFSGIKLEDLVWRENAVNLRLRSALLRILNANPKYRTQVEELQRNKPAAPVSMADASLPAFNLNTKFIDNLDQPFKSLATKLKDNKLMDAFNVPAAGKGAGPGMDHGLHARSAGMEAAAATGVVTSGNLFGLRERVVAVDSLLHIADEIKTAKASLQAALPSKLGRELESYFSRTVDATQDLRDCIFRGGARSLLTQGMLDPDKGCAAQVAATNYAGKDPATSYSPWTESLKKEYSTFRDLLDAAGLPLPIAAQMWEQAIAVAAECMLEGLGRVRRCTIEGRSAMSLDLSGVEKTLRGVAPKHVTINLRAVDTYIKAFYLPWEELPHWAQIHLPEYGKGKVLVLIECISEAFKIKRQQKRDLLAQIDAEMAEFA